MGIFPDVLPFSLEGPKYDHSTYMGRLLDIFNKTNPMGQFISSADLADAQSTIEKYKANGFKAPPGYTSEALWKARDVVSALTHPDDGSIIPFYGRASFFVFANVPICAGMLLGSGATLNVLAWQFINQSYNAVMNWNNRAKGEGVSEDEQLHNCLKSYAIASSTAVTVAFGLSKLAERAGGLPPRIRMLVRPAVQFTAVACAGSVNAVAMGYEAVENGIKIYDEDKNVLGTSEAAGKRALIKTALTRVVLPIPILLIPPFISSAATNIGAMNNMLGRGKYYRVIFDCVVIGVLVTGALPAAIAVFPMEEKVSVSVLEPEHQAYFRADGSKVETVYFNRGL